MAVLIAGPAEAGHHEDESARPVLQRTPYQPPLQKATPEIIAKARKHLQERRPDEALAALEGLEPAAPVLRLRVEAAVALGRVGMALESYDQLERVTGVPDRDSLSVVAHAVLDEIARTGDPLLRIESCRVQLEAGRTACLAAMEKLADDPAAPTTIQAQALSVAATRGDRRALSLLRAMAASAKGQDRRAAIDAARYLPVDEAVPLLADGLKSAQADQQFSAAAALGELPPPAPAARAALERFLAGDPTSPGRIAAELALASLGDTALLNSFAKELDTLGTGDLLRVASLLASRGDPRGVAALERVAKSDNELLRIRGAARLAGSRPELAREVMTSALTHDNPWLRAAALEQFAVSPLLDLRSARRGLADPDAWVRLRASAAVLERIARGLEDPPAPKPGARSGPGGQGV